MDKYIKWALYRNLLRKSPSPQLTKEVKLSFRHKNRFSVSAAESLLKDFNKISTCQKTSEYYDRLSALLGLKKPKSKPPPEVKKPVFKGQILWATELNHPMPRLKPQPPHIGAMINYRRQASQKRRDRVDVAEEMVLHEKFEQKIDKTLQIDREGEYLPIWKDDIRDVKKFWDIERKRGEIRLTPGEARRMIKRAKEQHPYNRKRG